MADTTRRGSCGTRATCTRRRCPSEPQNVPARLVLGGRLESLESTKDIALVGERLNPEHARVVVEKGDNVAAATERRHVDLKHVGVYKLEQRNRLALRVRERQSRGVRNVTSVARTRIFALLGSYFQTFDMIRPGKRLQRPKREVREATVPGGQFWPGSCS